MLDESRCWSWPSMCLPRDRLPIHKLCNFSELAIGGVKPFIEDEDRCRLSPYFPWPKDIYPHWAVWSTKSQLDYSHMKHLIIALMSIFMAATFLNSQVSINHLRNIQCSYKTRFLGLGNTWNYAGIPRHPSLTNKWQMPHSRTLGHFNTTYTEKSTSRRKRMNKVPA